MLSVIMLSVMMLSTIMLIMIMLNVTILCVIMLVVAALLFFLVVCDQRNKILIARTPSMLRDGATLAVMDGTVAGLRFRFFELDRSCGFRLLRFLRFGNFCPQPVQLLRLKWKIVSIEIYLHRIYA
jgi:hypothetical protein